MTGACEEVRSWPGLIPEMEREKRFAGMVASLFGVLGGWAGHELFSHLFYSSGGRIAALEQSVQQLTAALNEQIHSWKEVTDWLRKNINIVELRISALKLHTTVSAWTRGFLLAMHTHRLSVDFLPLHELPHFYKELQGFVHRQGVSFSLPPEVIYELPVSVLRTGKYQVELQVHIPLTYDSGDLLRLSHFPLRVPGSQQPFVFDEDHFLAVSDSAASYWVLSPHDLDSCLVINLNYFCPMHVTRMDFGQHCLAALFKGLWDEALKACKLRPVGEDWVVAHTHSDSSCSRFAVFNNKPIAFHMTCLNGTRASGTWQSGFHEVAVDKGCQAASAFFKLRAGLDVSFKENFVQRLDWTEGQVAIAKERKKLKEVPMVEQVARNSKRHETVVYVFISLCVLLCLLFCSILLVKSWRSQLALRVRGLFRRGQGGAQAQGELDEQSRGTQAG